MVTCCTSPVSFTSNSTSFAIRYPSGAVSSRSVYLPIEDTADIQKVEMKDDVTKLEISKQDIAGKELPGAKLTILDQDGKVVESWTSTDKAHYIERLPIVNFTLSAVT